MPQGKPSVYILDTACPGKGIESGIYEIQETGGSVGDRLQVHGLYR